MKKILPIITLGSLLALAGCSGAGSEPANPNAPAGSVSISTSEKTPVEAPVGQTTTWAYTITNGESSDISNLNLNLSQGPITAGKNVSAGLRSVPQCGTSLPRGQSCTFTVQYDAANLQPVQQVLTASYNTADRTGLNTTANISVNPFATSLQVNASPSSVSAIINTSTIFSLNFVNTSKTNDSITNISANGTNLPSDNSITQTGNTCTGTLNAGQSCVITYTFTPVNTSDSGNYNFSINYTENGAAVPASQITLSAQVLSASVKFSPDSTALVSTVGQTPALTANLVVNNNSNTALTEMTLVTPTSPLPSDIKIANNGCPDPNSGSLPAGQSCSYQLTYTPTNPDSNTLNDLFLQYKQSDINIPLSPVLIARVNYGKASMPASVPTINVPVDSSQAFTLLITPTLEDGTTALPTGQQTFPVKITSTTDSSITNNDGTFDFAGEFPGTTSDPKACPKPDASGSVVISAPCDIVLTFTPTQQITKTYPLGFQFTRQGPNGQETFSLPVNVPTKGLPAGEIQVTPQSSCTLENVAPIASTVCNYTLTNVGKTPDTSLNITAIEPDGALAGVLTLTNNTCPNVPASDPQGGLQPNDTCTVQITYNPGAPPFAALNVNGTGTLQMKYDQDGDTPETYPLPYSVGPSIPVVSPASISTNGKCSSGTLTSDFPEITITPSNTNFPLQLSSTPVSVNNGDNITLNPHQASTNCAAGDTITTANPCKLYLEFTSNKCQQANDTLTFNYTNVLPAGSGITLPAVTASATVGTSTSTLNWGSLSPSSPLVSNLNNSVTATIQLTETGTDPITVNPAGSSSLSFAPSTSEITITNAAPAPCSATGSFTIPTGATGCTFTIEYTPGSDMTGYSGVLVANYQIGTDQQTDSLNTPNFSARIQYSTLTASAPTAYAEPNSPGVIQIKLTPDSNYSTEQQAFLSANPLNLPSGGFTDVTSTIGKPDACTENASSIGDGDSSATAIPSSGCSLYVSYTPTSFTPAPTPASLTLAYSETDKTTHTLSISSNVSTDLLYVLANYTPSGGSAGNYLLAVDPITGDVLKAHAIIPFATPSGATSATPNSFVIDSKNMLFYVSATTAYPANSSDDTLSLESCSFTSCSTPVALTSGITPTSIPANENEVDSLAFGNNNLYVSRFLFNGTNNPIGNMRALEVDNANVPGSWSPKYNNAVAPFSSSYFSSGDNYLVQVYVRSEPQFEALDLTTPTTVTVSFSAGTVPYGVSTNLNAKSPSVLAATNAGIYGVTAPTTSPALTTALFGTSTCFDHAIQANDSTVYLLSGFLCGNTTATISYAPQGAGALKTFNLASVNQIYDIRLIQGSNFVG